MTRPETREEFIAHLRRKNFDLILFDGEQLDPVGLQALELSRQYAPEVPFVFALAGDVDDARIDSLQESVAVCLNWKEPSATAAAVPPAPQADVVGREETNHRLQQAQNLEAVATLAGGIAHDFNNILTIIKGHASLLERECASPERICEVATIIDHAARRGTDLVKEMLAFAQKSEGIFSLCDLNKLVRGAVKMFLGSIPHQIALEFALDESLPAFMLDEGQVERVILNLVGNARDAMPRGGRIIVSTGRVVDSLTVPCLSCLPAREYAYLQISDDGDGMDEKRLRRIFEPFFTTKPKGKGTGLGMPVVYGIIQMHQGAIDVISSPGKGTSVEVFFPLVLEIDHRGPSKESVTPKVQGGTETLLVVDDEPDVLSFLRAILEAEGYRILAAENAEEAVTLFHKHHDEVAMVFSDLGLPTLNGYELSEKLRQIKPGLKALLGSGYADSDIKRQVHEDEHTEFLAKPYAPAAILAAVRATLDAKGGAENNAAAESRTAA